MSDRIFVNIKPSRASEGARFLWDTGAMASLVTPDALAALLRQGAKVTDMPTTGYSLKAANGSPMPFDRIVNLQMLVSNRLIRVPCIVCPTVSCSILGMNAIAHHALEVDPVTREMRMARQSPKVCELNPTEGAFCSPARKISVPGRRGRMIEMQLCDASGNRLLGRREMVMDVASTCVVVATRKDGSFTAPFTNHRYETMTLQRGQLMSRMWAIDDFHFVDRATAEGYAVPQCAEVKCTTSQKPRRHTKAEKDEVIAKLTANVKKSTAAEFSDWTCRLLTEFEDVFSVNKEDVGICDWVEHKVDPIDPEKVVYVKQFRLSTKDQDLLRDQVASWLKCGIIKRTSSPHNNPIFCVPKPGNRGVRIVCDMRQSNLNTKTDLYSVPSVDQILEVVGRSNATIFSSLDLSSGFYHIPIREKDQQYAAFTVTNLGQYAFRRAIMGMAGAPATFSRAVDLMLGDLADTISYVDDILVYSRDIKKHLATLRQALTRLRKAGMRANPEKSVFCVREIDYLGSNITSDGVRPTLNRVEALQETKAPTTLAGVRRVLGVFNYMGGFIHNFARKTEPLRRLTRTDAYRKGPMPPEAVRAFEQIKRELCNRPVVCFVREGFALHLYVDFALGDHRGSGSGMGAVLLQERLDGLKQPVAYLSRSLGTSEMGLPPELGEWKAICWATEKLSHLLKHQRFYIHSDHKAIIQIQSKLGGAHKRILKQCKMVLEDFTPIWRYVKGQANTIADFLSRYHNLNIRPPELEKRAKQAEEHESVRRRRVAASVALITHQAETAELVDASLPRVRLLQRIDPRCSEIMKDIEEEVEGSTYDDPILVRHKLIKHASTTVTIIRGVLMIKPPAGKGKMDTRPIKVFTPEGMVPEVLSAYHTNFIANHGSRDATMERIRRHHWWPGIVNDVKEFVEKCRVCQKTTPQGTAVDAPLRPSRPPRSINERVNIDTFGPVTDRFNKGVYVSVIIESFTKHVTLKVMKDKTPESTAAALMEYIYVFGVPQEVVTDNGREYANDLYKNLRRMLKIDSKFASPMWPRCNGSAEAFMKELQVALRKHLEVAIEAGADFTHFLGPVALAHNTRINVKNRLSPHDVMFGYDPRIPLWESYEETFAAEPGNKSYADFVARHAQQQLTARRLVYNNRTHAQAKMKEHYDLQRVIDIPLYEPRMPVLAREFPRSNRKVSWKLAAPWSEAFILRRHNLSQFLIWRPGKRYGGGISKVNEAHLKPDKSDRGWLPKEQYEALLQEVPPRDDETEADSDGGAPPSGGEDEDSPGTEPEDTGGWDDADGATAQEGDGTDHEGAATDAGDPDEGAETDEEPGETENEGGSNSETGSSIGSGQSEAGRHTRKRRGRGRPQAAKIAKRQGRKRRASDSPTPGTSKQPDGTGRGAQRAGRKHPLEDGDAGHPGQVKRPDTRQSPRAGAKHDRGESHPLVYGQPKRFDRLGRKPIKGGVKRRSASVEHPMTLRKRIDPLGRKPLKGGVKRRASSQEHPMTLRFPKAAKKGSQQDSGTSTQHIDYVMMTELMPTAAAIVAVIEDCAGTLPVQRRSNRAEERKRYGREARSRRETLRWLIQKGEGNWTEDDMAKVQKICDLPNHFYTPHIAGPPPLPPPPPPTPPQMEHETQQESGAGRGSGAGPAGQRRRGSPREGAGRRGGAEGDNGDVTPTRDPEAGKDAGTAPQEQQPAREQVDQPTHQPQPPTGFTEPTAVRYHLSQRARLRNQRNILYYLNDSVHPAARLRAINKRLREIDQQHQRLQQIKEDQKQAEEAERQRETRREQDFRVGSWVRSARRFIRGALSLRK